MDETAVQTQCTEILDRIGEVVVTDRSTLETILVGILSDGHILLEDVPGTGKTLTARAFAEALGLSASRVQFTPDLLPADVVGSNVFNEVTTDFEFQPGPVFANVVLADEINRAPPKTQAALLEAMAEGQVTVDGESHSLPEPFVVIATQNPVESSGTFELPAAQTDRFMLKTSLGYPDRDGERELLDRRASRSTAEPSISQLCTREEITRLREAPESVRVDEKVQTYIVDIARATRNDRRVATGVSPRGIQRLFEAARGRAALSGRSYVTPDDIKQLAAPAFAHRLVLTPDGRVEGVSPAAIIEAILETVAVPQLTA